jgi:hypothetical protein
MHAHLWIRARQGSGGLCFIPVSAGFACGTWQRVALFRLASMLKYR